MSDWVHIEPPAPRLTPVQERIREMLRDGKTFRQICVALMMRSDYLRDEIYEIRKYEAIMGKGKNLTQEQREKIKELKSSGMTQKDIAAEMGVSALSVYRVLKAEKSLKYYHAKKEQAELEKKTGINPEFDAAVNEMIEEMHAEETAEPEEIEQVTEPVVMTDEHTAAVPNVVRTAVLYRIADIDDECNKAEAAIKALRTKIGGLTKERGELEIWLSEVQA